MDEDRLDMNVVPLENRTFKAALPFLSEVRPVSNFAKVCRLTSVLIDRLIRNDDYKKEFFQYALSGQAVEISAFDGYFIPHHAVLGPEATSTKLWIVFIASFGHDQSLNHLLWKGSAIGLNLVHHLFQFCLYKHILVADLSKAFLQINIKP